jgi:hypothetical protein
LSSDTGRADVEEGIDFRPRGLNEGQWVMQRTEALRFNEFSQSSFLTASNRNRLCLNKYEMYCNDMWENHRIGWGTAKELRITWRFGYHEA